MPYKHHEPVDISEMDRGRYQGHHSICQTLRDLFHKTDDEEMRLGLRLCMAMAKSMNKKLQDYKHQEEAKNALSQQESEKDDGDSRECPGEALQT